MTGRQGVLAWAMAAPAIVAAGMLIGLEVWRQRAPEAPLFSTPFAYSLAEAIARDDVSRAHAFIRAGQDPNAPIAVRHAVTGDRLVMLTPVLWAVAADAPQSVRMLAGYGATLDPASWRAAVCIARTLPTPAMTGVVQRLGAPDPAPPCPDAHERADMVAAFATGSP